MECHAEDPSPARLERVAAAAHHAAGDVVVCAAGWDTEVQVLTGAARVVWEAFESPRSVVELAATVGVDPDDEFLLDAIALLRNHDLIRPQG